MNTDQLRSCAYLENDFPFEIQTEKKLREIYTPVRAVSSSCTVKCGQDMKPYTHLSDKIWAFDFYRLVFLEETVTCNNYGET